MMRYGKGLLWGMGIGDWKGMIYFFEEIPKRDESEKLDQTGNPTRTKGSDVCGVPLSRFSRTGMGIRT